MSRANNPTKTSSDRNDSTSDFESEAADLENS